jgi:hypothetical protein
VKQVGHAVLTVSFPSGETDEYLIRCGTRTLRGLHTGAVFHDVTSPKEEVTVASIEEQSEWESSKLWLGVAKGIGEGDFETAATFKGKIEVCSFRYRMVLLGTCAQSNDNHTKPVSVFATYWNGLCNATV